MWVDKGAILVAKTFPLVAQLVHTEINALSRPKGSRWTPPVEIGWPSSLPTTTQHGAV